MSHQIIIPETIGESPSSIGDIDVTGREVVSEGFYTHLVSLISNTRGRIYILTDIGGREYEITLRFNGVFGHNFHDTTHHHYSAEILLKPGKYTVKPKN